NPELDGALARSHANFERLLAHRHVGIDPDPHLPRALHVAGERPPRGLDLARGDAVRLHRLEAVLAKRQVLGAGREAVNPALVRLAELGARRLQHDEYPSSSLRGLAARTAGFRLGKALI